MYNNIQISIGIGISVGLIYYGYLKYIKKETQIDIKIPIIIAIIVFLACLIFLNKNKKPALAHNFYILNNGIEIPESLTSFLL